MLKSGELKKKDITDDEVLAVMRGAFMRTDSVIMQRSKTEGWNDGCTVVAVLVLNSKFVLHKISFIANAASRQTMVQLLLMLHRLYIGNLGDAEAVVARQKPEGLVAECVTYKHKPNSPEERERIEKAGGHVVFGRVLGSLAVSRAFGDSEFKAPRNKAEEHFVSSDPFLQAVPIGPDVPFMIIACDGLWDKVCIPHKRFKNKKKKREQGV